MPKHKPPVPIRLTHCKQCSVKLTEENSVYNDGWKRYNSCRECHVKQHRARKQENNFIKNYGITQQEYDRLNELHQGGCAICRQPCTKHVRLSVDHDHKTGVVRGLLCHSCNTAIAMLKEDEDLFWNALEYLKKHKWSKTA